MIRIAALGTSINMASMTMDFTPNPHTLLRRIAVALGGVNRWAGNSVIPVTVQTHSINVYREVLRHTDDKTVLRTALLHDAVESIIGDIPSPLKDFIPEIREVEARLWDSIIAPSFNTPRFKDVPDVIHHADLEVSRWEVEHYRVPAVDLGSPSPLTAHRMILTSTFLDFVNCYE
jgi:hypothetical protein